MPKRVQGAALGKALGKPGSVPALIALLENGPMRPYEITKILGGYRWQGMAVTKHLRALGWVDLEAAPGRGGRPGYMAHLTKSGQSVARLLRDADRFVKPVGQKKPRKPSS